MISGRDDAELAETGYNTIFRKLAGRDQLNNDLAFVLAPAETYPGDYAAITQRIGPNTEPGELVRRSRASCPCAKHYSNL